MTSSKIKQIFFKLIFLAAFKSFSAVAAPISLIPDDSAIVELPAIQIGTVVKDVNSNSNGITVIGLDDININNTGFSYDDQEGYAFDVWQGADNKTLSNVLDHLDTGFKFNVFYDIVKKLLTVSAKPPLNADNFLYYRLKTLVKLGMTSESLKLIKMAGLKNFDNIIKPKIDGLYLLLLLIEDTKICDNFKSLGDNLDNITKQKIEAVCYLNQNQNDKALLKVNLLRDSGYSDNDFYNLIEYITGASLSKPDMATIVVSPLNIIAALNNKELANLLPEETDNIWYYKVLALNNRTPASKRIKAAEKALSLGIIKNDIVEKAYFDAEFKPKELEKALSIAAKISPHMGRAILYQSIINRKSSAEQIEIIAKAFSLEKSRESLVINASVYNPIINELVFSKNISWFYNYAACSMVYSNSLNRINEVLDTVAIIKTKKTALAMVLSRFFNISYNQSADYEQIEPFTCVALNGEVLSGMEHKNSGETLLILASVLKTTEPAKICPHTLEKILNLLKRKGFKKEAENIAYQALIESYNILNY